MYNGQGEFLDNFGEAAMAKILDSDVTAVAVSIVAVLLMAAVIAISFSQVGGA